jgi:hypothetical protein
MHPIYGYMEIQIALSRRLNVVLPISLSKLRVSDGDFFVKNGRLTLYRTSIVGMLIRSPVREAALGLLLHMVTPKARFHSTALLNYV